MTDKALIFSIYEQRTQLSLKLPYNPAIPLQGIYLEKNIVWNVTCTPVFTAALFTIAKTWKQHKCPSTEEWVTMRCIHSMEHYSAIKRSKVMPWMKLEIAILSELQQRTKNIMWYPLLVESRKANELIYKTETHRLREQTYGYQTEKTVLVGRDS